MNPFLYWIVPSKRRHETYWTCSIMSVHTVNKIALSYRTGKADARTAIGAHAAEMEITGGSYYDNSRLQLQMITVEMCQLNPLLPNQSDCFSRYLSWRNFIAQSIITSAQFWLVLIVFSWSCFAASWFTERTMWTFHSKISVCASLKSYSRSSRCSLP